ncbi:MULTISPECIES: GNAT family N-acetyltransferase [unclassified Microbacterium]|uniref:GNAT family N-acetyltransferase n=1 Tax=unclassified Microbacterium TaxID=2609290 RepID=UPI00214CFAE5|nr:MULTISPECIES: GNAT family N-acetyltransferase [unclassified Microbacterium]MCR2785726.1 GNAT family N-acetyltransferase [Microbacterium sp. zg.B96]WIM17290.1 GNAT family N-acetyltransferase [Microbacterium sp. zg-B96]
MTFNRLTAADTGILRAFLRDADLTLAGLNAPAVRLWVERAADGSIIGSTGYELSDDGAHALIRSVAIAPEHRGTGAGSRLAMFAMADAAASGATRAWLFSRRSGPFWRKLGFAEADRDELAAVLSQTCQVRLFVQTAQLDHEVAWSRAVADLALDARDGGYASMAQ